MLTKNSYGRTLSTAPSHLQRYSNAVRFGGIMPFEAPSSARMPVAQSTDEYPKDTFHFTKLADASQDGSNGKKAKDSILNWCESFLSQPHPKAGHKGPVCPFTPTALKKNTIWFAVETDSDPDPEQLVEKLKKLSEEFGKMEPRAGREAPFKTAIIVFPNLDLAKAPMVIDNTQRRVKKDFVKKGLMIGEFHELNNNPGAHSSNFHPFQTPVPSFNIRVMVPQDLHFLDDNKYDPLERIAFLGAYLDQNFSSHFQDAAQLSFQEALEDQLLWSWGKSMREALLMSYRNPAPFFPI